MRNGTIKTHNGINNSHFSVTMATMGNGYKSDKRVRLVLTVPNSDDPICSMRLKERAFETREIAEQFYTKSVKWADSKLA